MGKITALGARTWSGIVTLMRHDFKLAWTPRLFSWLSTIGLVVVAFVVGTGWMYFQLPGSSSINHAFRGGSAFMERGVGQGVRTTRAGVTTDKPDKTFDGFTLFTTNGASSARLVNMKGRTVHQWALPFSKAIPNSKRKNPLSDEKVHWFCCRLFANGDLLAVYQTELDTPPGYGMVKLDKDSKVLWHYDNYVHHSIDVGDDGKIYALTNRLSMEPPPEMESMHTPFFDEYLTVLSPEGQEIEQISLLQAYRDSPYALTLANAETAYMPPTLVRDGGLKKALAAHGDDGEDRPGKTPRPDGARRRAQPPHLTPWQPGPGDLLHPNSVRVLNSGLAAKFPLFRANQVLISLRSISTIAMVDIDKRAVVWSAQGLWKSMHNPEFLPNGRFLIYDNEGSTRTSRVLEYDPQTGVTPWCYANENAKPFVARARGMAQRLGNGNTLIVDPDGVRVFEVTRAKELVWEMGFQPVDGPEGEGNKESLTSAWRFAPAELPFLKEVSARP